MNRLGFPRRYCAYGFAPVLHAAAAAASGDAERARAAVSFAHFVWLDKPWSGHVPLAAGEMHGTVTYLFHKPWIVVMSGFWWREWRRFANATFVGREFNPAVLADFDAPDVYVNADRAALCLGPAASACGAVRTAADEPFPDGGGLGAVRASKCVKAP